MDPLIQIPQSVLAQLVASHSRLAQAEYKRDSSYNDQHFSHKAEDAFLAFVSDHMDKADEARFWARVEFFAGKET